MTEQSTKDLWTVTRNTPTEVGIRSPEDVEAILVEAQVPLEDLLGTLIPTIAGMLVQPDPAAVLYTTRQLADRVKQAADTSSTTQEELLNQLVEDAGSKEGGKLTRRDIEVVLREKFLPGSRAGATRSVAPPPAQPAAGLEWRIVKEHPHALAIIAPHQPQEVLARLDVSLGDALRALVPDIARLLIAPDAETAVYTTQQLAAKVQQAYGEAIERQEQLLDSLTEDARTASTGILTREDLVNAGQDFFRGRIIDISGWNHSHGIRSDWSHSHSAGTITT